MKRLAVMALSAGLCLAVSGVAVPAASAAPAKAVVKGHVTSPSGKPIAGVVFKVVQRIPGRDFVSVRGRTSATGRYEARLPRGTSYQLVVTDPGDADRDTGDGAWASATRKVVSDASTIRIDATMHHGAGLSGHVYGPGGGAVRAGLLVRAYRAADGAGRGLVAVGATLTRKGGIYRFSNLPAGRTIVGFESGQPNTDDRFYTGSPGGTEVYTDATPITLVAGRAVTRRTFRFVQQRDPSVDLRPDGAVDPVGDAPDFLDITDLRVGNGDQDLVVRTTIPRFDPAALDQSFSGTGNSFSGLTLTVHVTGVDPTVRGNPRPDEFLVTVGPGAPNAPIDSVAFSQYTEDELSEYPCPGLTATVEQGEIVTTIPQACFGELTGADRGAVTVQAITQGNVGAQGERDDTIRTRLIRRS